MRSGKGSSPEMHYHLAQINVGRMVAPFDSPQLAPFVARLAEVNAEAEMAPGFVWRPVGESVRGDDDPLMLYNYSVWQSVEALKQYTYSPGHVDVFRSRAQWFEKATQASLALWWIPAGHTPTLDECLDRLDLRRREGDTAAAFSFATPYPAPDGPSSEQFPSTIDLDGREFVTAANSANGDAGNATRFRYCQQGARVWATYAGGAIRFGILVAVFDRSGRLDMRYQHVTADDSYRTGRCASTPELLPDGRIRLIEEWQWTNGDCSRGSSVLEELRRG